MQINKEDILLRKFHIHKLMPPLSLTRLSGVDKPRYLKRKWQINQVCGRVNDLVNKYGVVRDLGPHKGRWHGLSKTYHLWAAVGDDRKPVGWKPVLKENLPQSKPSLAETKTNLGEIRSRIEKPILKKLFEHCKVGRRITTTPTGQTLLF